VGCDLFYVLCMGDVLELVYPVFYYVFGFLLGIVLYVSVLGIMALN
jgi:hypothetical protein